MQKAKPLFSIRYYCFSMSSYVSSRTSAITLGSGLVISYVPQDTSYLCGTLSEFAEENNLDESLFKAILRKMDFERVQFEKDIKDFSGGQKKKVLIAKSLCEKAHLYVYNDNAYKDRN